MLISIIVILLIGAVAYWHYLQGLFSAAVSAMLALVCAYVAVGYHEVVVTSILGGKFADQAHAIVLVSLFGLPYLVLRLIFDNFVPGNVRFPVIMDKVGAPIMGVVAGMAVTGVVMLAADNMPFGGSFGTYSRYEMHDKAIRIEMPGKSQLDRHYEALNAVKFADDAPGDRASLVVPVDGMLLNQVKGLSKGALAAGQPFDAIHPDYLRERFAQRLVTPSGAKMVAFGDLTVRGIYLKKSFPSLDAEMTAMRSINDTWKEKGKTREVLLAERPVYPPANPDQFPFTVLCTGDQLLIISILADRINSDEDNRIRFTPGSVRMMVGGKDYFPIGTLHDAAVLCLNLPDDVIVAEDNKPIDLVFQVTAEDVFRTDPDTGKLLTPSRLKDGSFIEFKRMARARLDKDIRTNLAELKEDGVLHKIGLFETKGQTPHPTNPDRPPTGDNTQPKYTPVVTYIRTEPSNKLFTPIYVEQADTDGAHQFGNASQFSLQAGKFSDADLVPEASITKLATQAPGRSPIQELRVEARKSMVQTVFHPLAGDKWAWTNLNDFELITSSGATKPSGVWAKLNDRGTVMLALKYQPDSPPARIDLRPDDKKMEPAEVGFLFVVPAGSELKALHYKGEQFQPLTGKAP